MHDVTTNTYRTKNKKKGEDESEITDVMSSPKVLCQHQIYDIKMEK